MFTTILNAIAAIPALIKSIRELIGWFEKVEEEKWFQKKTEAFQDARKAESEEEFKNAAKKIHDATS